MILFILNNKFPENSGFALRCKRAIDILSSIDEVKILCRGNNHDIKHYTNENGKCSIYTFNPISSINDLAKNYISGLYELIRNIDLMIQLGIKFIKIYLQNRSKDVNVYVVNSPLTVPLIIFLISKFINVRLKVLEFHDLEPELALQIKDINKNNLVYKVEIWLEKFICQRFNKIITTTDSQAGILSNRTNVKINNILVIPNTVPSVELALDKKSNNEFNVGYFSSLNYKYATEGIIWLINNFSEFIKKIPTIKLYVVGNGIAQKTIQDSIQKNNLQEHVIIIKDNNNVMQKMDICIIPWSKNEMTQTMLPTKLFQYMSLGKVIIAPNFGEFKKVLNNNEEAVLFNTFDEIKSLIVDLNKDPAIMKKMSSKVYDKFNKNYKEELFTEKLKKFYNQ